MKSAVKAISIYKFIILRALNITPKAHNGIKLKKRKRL
jgi:ribosomal protein S11